MLIFVLFCLVLFMVVCFFVDGVVIVFEYD